MLQRAHATILCFGALVMVGCGIGAGPPAVDPGPPVGLRPPPAPSVAVTRDGSRFAETIAYRGGTLVLNGSGLCEWGIFGIDLYRAALYAERRVASSAAALAADQVMVVHLDFSRALTTDQLVEAYTASVRANTGEDFDAYRPALEQLVATMAAVEAGDTYTFVADPARGLLVQRGDALLATIDDQAFRQLFVELYVGDRPPTAALRAGLLGGKP